MIGKVAVSTPHRATTKDVASDEAVIRIWAAAAKEVEADAAAVHARRHQNEQRMDWAWVVSQLRILLSIVRGWFSSGPS